MAVVFQVLTRIEEGKSQSLVNEGRFPLSKILGIKITCNRSQSLVNEGRFPHGGCISGFNKNRRREVAIPR